MHKWVNDHHEELPRIESKSVQTIGRRIDKLHEAGLVESCILAPDAVNREMIIGYKLTGDGKKYMDAERKEFLKDKVMRASEALLDRHDENDQFSISRPALISLMVDEFDIAGEARDTIEECRTDELIAVLMSHFFRTEGLPSFDEDAGERITTLIRGTPALREPYMDDTLAEQVKQDVINDEEMDVNKEDGETRLV